MTINWYQIYSFNKKFSLLVARRTIYWRIILIIFFILGGSLFIKKFLTPPDYMIEFKLDCDGTRCEKVKFVHSERATSIENEIKSLSEILERIDSFAKFTFLRFDFQVTNMSQLDFVVTQPFYEKGVDFSISCSLNGKDYVFPTNSGITFSQKSSIGNVIEELNNVQNLLIKCNPSPQNIVFTPLEQVIVSPNASVKFIYKEEKYHLQFLPDRLNFILTVLQMFIVTGIFFGAYSDITKFVKYGLKSQ